MVVKAFSKAFGKVFGTRNDRLLKKYRVRVDKINTFEPQMRKLTDAELKTMTQTFRDRVKQGEDVEELRLEALAVARETMDRAIGIRNIFNPEHNFDASQLPDAMQTVYHELMAKIETFEPVNVLGCGQIDQLHHDWDPVPNWLQVEAPPELYQAVRDLYPKSKPPFRARPFDVQLLGGMVLSEGSIAEMKTGEGKTIVAPLACYLACLEELQCYVVTVNDYLVQRDRDWVFPFYFWTGLTVGAIHPHHMQPAQGKADAYACDVLYGTNSEFGFDYLRDNMKLSVEEQHQNRRDFCIIDEVDSILVDEARTPLIISGTAHNETPRYELADALARHLIKKQRDWDAAEDRVQKCEMRIKGLEGDIRNARDKDQIPKMKEEKTELEEKEMPRLEAVRDQHTQYFEVEPEKKASHLEHEGIAEAQKIANIGSFYVGNNMDMPHLLENALRAHAIYKRDKDYVVQGGEVVIVDENTGRLMVGRQWSDGLHQAIEAKEGVKIKEETQTLATVTIQNYFKMFKRLAGMTGTAITEATEFAEIYGMDVVCIPTNVPIQRIDRNDLIFLSAKDKWTSIMDEVKAKHDLGRPVLVGTTSVEKSEFLSEMLRKRYGIQHEVLNAKQHEREAGIVQSAGGVGAVMIATNMAGRGTDIKLAPIEREVLVRHWQQRNMLPKQAKAEMSDEDLVALAYRHMAQYGLGIKKKEVEELTDDQVKLLLLRSWAATETYVGDKAASMSADECIGKLDELPEFQLHRLKIYENIEEMGGLHIVGTERHEARRIDNQLRGRAGRQGDNGGSRFFISLEDDLMKMFAGKTTLTALSKLGMREGDAIEHKWITKSVERAQRKVEERNFENRKSLLEYDEPMDVQRKSFYSIRQQVLRGEDVESVIFDYLSEVVEDAVPDYYAKDYLQNQIAEWCREVLDVSVVPNKMVTDNLRELQRNIREEAVKEAHTNIDVEIGEYMSNDVPPEEWDLRGLASRAMNRYQVNLSQSQLREMNIDAVKDTLVQAARDQIEKKDLDGVAKFTEEHYPQKQLADWAKQKFDIDLDPAEWAAMQSEVAVEKLIEMSLAKYAKREIEYPVDFALDMAFATAEQDGDFAAEQLCNWVKNKYDADWQAEDVTKTERGELREKLLAESEKWADGAKVKGLAKEAAGKYPDAESMATWASKRFGKQVTADELKDVETRQSKVEAMATEFLRSELAHLERYVLLEILDSSWKDHLYAMEVLREEISTRSVVDKERDPRVVYKREGAAMFTEMQRVVRDKVTDLIFRARLTPQVQQKSHYAEEEAVQADADSAYGQSSGRQRGTAAQEADLHAAERTGGEEQFQSRKQRRSAIAQARKGGKKRPGGRKR